MRPLILYHNNCSDGFCAAWVAHKIYPNGEFIAVNYGQNPPIVKDRFVLILDFSYKSQVLFDMVKDASKIIILDHHKTSQEDLSGFEQMSYNLLGERKCEVTFNMIKSGARLTWNHFYGNSAKAPWLVDYTEDYDLGIWALYHTHEINAALQSYPFDFSIWSKLESIQDIHESLAQEGQAITRYQKQEIAKAMKRATMITLAGHKILSINTTVLQTQIGAELAKEMPFSATWFVREDGKKQWSLRSTRDGLDVADIAKVFGGGGHARAAGFETDYAFNGE